MKNWINTKQKAMWVITIAAIFLMVIFIPKDHELASEIAFLMSSVMCKFYHNRVFV